MTYEPVKVIATPIIKAVEYTWDCPRCKNVIPWSDHWNKRVRCTSCGLDVVIEPAPMPETLPT